MNALRDLDRAIAGGLAAAVRERMTRLDPTDIRGKARMLMSPDRDRLPDRHVRPSSKCGGHRRCGLADGNDVQTATREHIGNLAIAQRARDHTISGDRVNAGAND